MDKNLTVCVITFNSAKYLPDLLESIRKSYFKEFNLLFIDNASTDNTVEYLEKFDIEKSVIKLSGNMGHSYAANIAIKECKTKYLILLDHDTIVDENLFEKLYLEAEKEIQCVFCGGQIAKDIQHCAWCGTEIPRCLVCRSPIYYRDEFVKCPYCGSFAHGTHLIEWVKVKGHCPYCRERLTEFDIPL